MDYTGAMRGTPPTNVALIKPLMDLLVAINSTNNPKTYNYYHYKYFHIDFGPSMTLKILF